MKTLRLLSIVTLILFFASCSKDDSIVGPSSQVTVSAENLGVKMVAVQQPGSDKVNLTITTTASTKLRYVRYFTLEHSIKGIDRYLEIGKNLSEQQNLFSIKEGGKQIEKIVIYEVGEVN